MNSQPIRKSNLVLMPAIQELDPITPAILWEVAAAKYLKLAIQDFRTLVNDEAIKFRTHPGHSRRIYLKEDLDRYARNLPVGNSRAKMAACEEPPGPQDKGVHVG